MSLESLIFGTPSAFFQIGWDYRQLDKNYRNVDIVPKLRTSEQLSVFVDSVRTESVLIPDNIESYEGALLRIWEVISEVRTA